MPLVAPISTGEFLQYLQRCMPPGGWKHRLVVANSGGPDSVCLLFLLASLLKHKKKHPGLPTGLVSVHVDHSLQDASAGMAHQAASSAGRLRIMHLNMKIPWSTPPFPRRPLPGTSFEEVCRDARQKLIVQAMDETGSYAIAFAHHADDQVETAVMRLAHGSSPLGAIGMRPVRRLGMGEREDNPLTWAGVKGMNRYIVRPLLPVSKDRILATCEANGLKYVTDPTNSQPDITLRNYIRHVLRHEPEAEKTPSSPSPFAAKASHIRVAEQYLREISPQLTGHSQLRDAVRQVGQTKEKVDDEATNFIVRHRVSSPPSTVLLPHQALQSLTNTEIQCAVVRRILRYVSPHPWGHVLAEASGSRETLRAIADAIRSPFNSDSLPSSFTKGAKVWWRPVYLHGNRAAFGFTPSKGYVPRLGWLAQRERQWSEERRNVIGAPDPLVVDITYELRAAYAKSSTVDVTYDRRVFIRFDMKRCPPNLARSILLPESSIHIVSATQFSLPQVILRVEDSQEIILADFRWKEHNRIAWIPKQSLVDAPWVHMHTIRSLDPW